MTTSQQMLIDVIRSRIFQLHRLFKQPKLVIFLDRNTMLMLRSIETQDCRDIGYDITKNCWSFQGYEVVEVVSDSYLKVLIDEVDSVIRYG